MCYRVQAACWKCWTQKFAIWAPSHNFAGIYIFATKARIGNRKKLLNSNISSTCPHNMVNFGPLAAEIDSLVWATPANFKGFRVLVSLLQRRRSTEASQTLHDVWASPGLVHYTLCFKKSSHLLSVCNFVKS